MTDSAARSPGRCPRVIASSVGGLTRCGNEMPCSDHRRLDGVPIEELEAELARRNRDHDGT